VNVYYLFYFLTLSVEEWLHWFCIFASHICGKYSEYGRENFSCTIW